MTKFIQLSPFDQKATQHPVVQFCVVVALPFRLRVGSMYTCPIASHPGATIAIRNAHAIPHPLDTKDFAQLVFSCSEDKGRPYRRLFSEALILLPPHNLHADDIRALREDRSLMSLPSGGYFLAHSILNYFLEAYVSTSNTLFGGTAIQPRPDTEFLIEDMIGSNWIIHEKEPTHLSTEQADTLFRKCIDRAPGIGPSQFYGDLHDLSGDILAALPETLAKHHHVAFYEFAYRAKDAMLDRDFGVALILACAALEGVHQAVLSSLNEKLIVDADQKTVRTVQTELLREFGFSTMIKYTSLLLMPQHRPSDDLLKRCQEAITARNSFMHLGIDKKGSYKIHKYKNASLTEHYKTLLEVYDIFRRVFEEMRDSTGETAECSEVPRKVNTAE